ncbi:MAG: tetratricopeptide repeat protein [Chloroflexi bacterium]|nr:tetratricopeptide repeat protein [Chloroflexota bacterium]
MSPSNPTMTFLFTDIEGSTKLWEQHPDAMQAALARHDALLRGIITENQGAVFKTMGDAFYAVFSSAPNAMTAALAMQRALRETDWGEIGALKIRIAIHVGTVEAREGDYFGPPLNRVARLLSAAHGGQILMSLAVCELVRDQLPAGVSVRDLGEHRLKDLVRPERIFQLVVHGLPADFPALRSLDMLPNNLPGQLTSFIGRERELTEVKQMLVASRLVTLIGAGGIGKTRLAVQAAAESLELFNDGAWHVELALISDPLLVPHAIASALNLREETGKPLLNALADYLRARNLLLVLDNCEHLNEPVAQLAETLLQVCPRMQIIASSRVALGIAGERIFRVPSLAMPDMNNASPIESLAQNESVRLFLDRAKTAQPTFALNEQNAALLAQICARLDGIPLAIELAAARAKVLSPEEILARLSDRFHLLTGGSRSALPRQQTLRAMMDWSYGLLDDRERALFRRLSVFAGGWTLEAAELVVADEQTVPRPDVVDLLTRLVDQSLVLSERQDEDTRYRMLETIRQYAQGKLFDSEEANRLRHLHCAYFLTFAQAADSLLRGPQQVEWLNRLEREHDNLRAALGWALEGEAEEIPVRLSGALWRFWLTRGYLSEGQRWLTSALAKAEAASAPASLALAKALDGAGMMALVQRDLDRAESSFEAALKMFRKLGNKKGMGVALNSLGSIAQDHADYERAQTMFATALELHRALGDRWGIASALNNLGLVALNQGDLPRAQKYFEESREARRVLGDKQGIASALSNLCVVALHAREYAKVNELGAESVALFREVGNRRGVAAVYTNQGRAALYASDAARAFALLSAALTLFQQVGDRAGIAECLEWLASVSIARHGLARAARLFGAAEALREKIGMPLTPVDRSMYDQAVAFTRERTDPYTFTESWAQGRAMTLEQAIAFALEKDAGKPAQK